MSVALYDGVTIRRLLLLQCITSLVVSIALCFYDLSWGISGLAGALTACLPNGIFILFTRYNQQTAIASNTIAWSFAIGWMLKLVTTMLLFVVAIAVFKAEFIPFGLVFLSVLIMQMLAPVLINSFCNQRHQG